MLRVSSVWRSVAAACALVAPLAHAALPSADELLRLAPDASPQAIRLALEQGVTLCTYGDCLRVPASDGLSLMKAKARGGDIRMVYSSADAVALAQKNPDKQVVFFAIGFETTTPPTAVAIKQAAALGLKNFSVLCCHVLTPSAISSILESPEVRQWGTVPLAQQGMTPYEILPHFTAATSTLSPTFP